MRRREFIERAGFAFAGALVGSRAVTGAAGGATRVEPSRELLVQSLRPENLATPIGWFDRLITPNDVFFVRSHFGAPMVVRDGRLRIEGLVRQSVTLSVADLERMPQTTVTAVLQCAGNGRSFMDPRVPGVQWEQGAMGQATWTGVRLRDLFERAGIAAGAVHVAIEGTDRSPTPSVPAFHRSIPLERAIDPTTLVALRMNGEPLAHAHGAPFRLVVPGWAANHWMKWLAVVRLQDAEAQGFYMQTGYRLPKTPIEPGAAVPPENTTPVTLLPLKSVIARPVANETRPRGAQEIAGVAFSGEAAIARVEVSLDGGAAWKAAVLEGEAGIGRWQVFRYRFDAAPGRVRAMARAIDARDRVQPERAAWNPSGYHWNGWHAVEWVVV